MLTIIIPIAIPIVGVIVAILSTIKIIKNEEKKVLKIEEEKIEELKKMISFNLEQGIKEIRDFINSNNAWKTVHNDIRYLDTVFDTYSFERALNSTIFTKIPKDGQQQIGILYFYLKEHNKTVDIINKIKSQFSISRGQNESELNKITKGYEEKLRNIDNRIESIVPFCLNILSFTIQSLDDRN